MNDAHHIIRQYTFDVQFRSRAKAFALQDRISSIFQHRISADTAQLLQQLVPENIVAVLDTLELDLGIVLYKDVETELPAKIMDALEKALTAVLRSGVPPQQHTLTGPVQIKNGDDRLYELLTHYLLSGTLPWWATAAERAHPDEAVLHLAGTDPGRLAVFLRDLAQFAYVRKRIAYQFSIAVIHQVVTVLEPAEATFIFEYSREIVRIQQEQTVLQTAGKTLERAVWLFVLTYLVMESSTNFNRKQFVRSNLAQMAHHFNTDYDTLLQLFYDALQFYRQDMPATTVGGFIKTLYEESPGFRTSRKARRISSRQAVGAGDLKEYAPEEQLDLLRYYLLHGSFPWWAPPVAIALLYDTLLALAQKAPAPLKEMLALVLQQEQAWKRWTGIFNTTQQETISSQLGSTVAWQANEMNAAHKAVLPGRERDTTHLQLRDLLLYRLIYGSIPWWGSTYAHFSLNSLLQQLMDQSAEQAVLVFKYAGTIPHAMERFIGEAQPPLFFSIARAAGMPGMAYEAYESVYALLQVVNTHISAGASVQSLQKQLIKAFWQAWAAEGYRHFSLPAFIDVVIQLWSAVTGITPGSLLFLMRNALPAIKEIAGNQLLVTPLQQLMTAWQTDWEAIYYAITVDWEPGKDQSYHPLIHVIRKGMAIDAAAERDKAGQLITGWLRYFLAEGSMPAATGDFTQQETTWLAGKMLEWLYINYKERLTDIPTIIQPLPGILNRLFDLWQTMGATPTPIRELLAGWMEKAFAPPAAGTMVVMDGLWQVIPELLTVPVAEKRITLPAAISRLLHRFQQYDTITSTSEKQQWLEQAAELLTYFLTWHKLPDHLGIVNTATANELLKLAVILLFRERPALLYALFSTGNGTVPARVQVYNLFAAPAGILETRIRQSLDAYALQDSLLLLQETAGNTFNHPAAGFREAIRFYKHQSRQERLSFYKKVFQHPVLVQHAAQQLDDAAFLDLVQDIDIGWGHPATAALKELQQLFDGIITDSLEKEKIRLLFRQFHIMLLAGHFTIHNAKEYSGRFLEFLTTAGGATVESFIGRLATTKGKINVVSYTHIRNILPALQQQAMQYVQTHLHMENIRHSLYESGGELSSSNDSATLPAPPPPAAAVTPTEPVKPVNREWETVKKPALDTIYVNNAGLVLLHPFLTTAFQRLGLLQAGQFVNEDAQIRAIHLLQYTVNGQEEHPEHALALNKVLCNFPLEEPVPFEIPLTEAEKQLSQELLQVVIQQWERMNNSSVAGFQAAFLQREGALWQTEEGWFLRVEQRGYDVIMQTLPWGIGMVKTSWMDKALYTEWVYT